MNTFEKVFVTDPIREKMENLDKHRCIELSDKEYLKKCELVYRPQNLEEPMSPVLKEKYEKDKKICEDTYVIDMRSQSVEQPKKKTKSKAKK
jgi:hypothetical protein